LDRPVGRQINRQLFVSFAFTLAEVLIVLGIIGIVAEMTIPTLVQSTQQQVAVTSVKKAYSVLSQAYIMTVQENGTPDAWALGGSAGNEQGSINILNMFVPYLKLSKNCGSGSGCIPDGDFYKVNRKDVMWSDMNNKTMIAKALLADGSWIWFYTYGSCGTNAGAIPDSCGAIAVDINGFKKPNAVANDIFEFYITTKGIVPTGMPGDTTVSNFANNCISGAGEGCTAWAIYNGNTDYLKCNTLSWNGQTKCN